MEISAVAPDGTQVSIKVGAKRVVGAIRITRFQDGEYLVTVHKSLTLAIEGANQTPEWNNLPRHAIAVDAGVTVGPWFGASK